MRRRNSLLGILPRSPSDPDLAGEKNGCSSKARRASTSLSESGRSMSQEETAAAVAAADRQRRETVLPSQQLRRWRKLGRVVGVAMGMREISKSYKCSSDPELVSVYPVSIRVKIRQGGANLVASVILLGFPERS
jgi:hypothetical protein